MFKFDYLFRFYYVSARALGAAAILSVFSPEKKLLLLFVKFIFALNIFTRFFLVFFYGEISLTNLKIFLILIDYYI